MHEASLVAEVVGGIVALLLIAAATQALSHKLKFPFSVALVIVGMVLGALADYEPHVFGLFAELELSADLILYVFLPTLVFESAYHLELRALQRNIWPVLTLAVPGLLISTFLIGGLVSALTDIPIGPALLLGSILSATDPVAVIALFKRLGAPKRLTILVEGESLLNDATSIVLSRILVGIIAAGTFGMETVGSGILDFVVVFFGGAVVGWVLGSLTGYLLGKIHSDAEIEITLTTVLAYLSFLIAEEGLHVSGVMAVVAAGLCMGSQNWMRVSHKVRGYLVHFWEYMAFVATALIFLMVGLQVHILDIVAALPELSVVILAMLISRALVVFGLIPVAGRLPGAEPISRPYQAVMYWGGLRGAIALAIVLSLPDEMPFKAQFTVLIMGAVLFTLLVPGLSMDKLVKKLGLDTPPLTDRIAEFEGIKNAKRLALKRLPELGAGGLFSASLSGKLESRYRDAMVAAQQELEALRANLSDADAHQLAQLHALAKELSLYHKLFNSGHLSERVFRRLCTQLAEMQELARQHRPLPESRLLARGGAWLRRLEAVPLLAARIEDWRLHSVATDYQTAWAIQQACTQLIENLESQQDGILDVALHRVYRTWNTEARTYLDHTAEQFPEFVTTMQERHAGRLALHAEADVLHQQARSGALPAGIADRLLAVNEHEVSLLSGLAAEALRVSPEELLRNVPFFAEMPENEFAALIPHLKSHTVSSGDDIISQGESGESLYLIARGVVRVVHTQDGAERELATLMAGDFFGEMALLHHEPRGATVRAVSPCTVYDLNRDAVARVMKEHPAVREALEAADKKRRG